MRRLRADDESFVRVEMRVPTRLHVVDTGNSETIRECWRRDLPFGSDATLDATVPRVISVSSRDDFGGNDKAERDDELLHPTRHRLSFPCEDHKATTVYKWGSKLNSDLETNCIRLALASKGPPMRSIRQESRQVLAEQLVCYYGGSPGPIADAHREAVYSLYLSGDGHDVQFRYCTISQLWNGNIQAPGRHEHYCRGCCKNRRQTLHFMQSFGLDCLLPSSIHVINRSNFVGMETAMDQIGLPTEVNQLLPTALMRVFLFNDATTAPMPALAALFDGEDVDGDKHADANDADDAACNERQQRVDAAEARIKPISVWREEKESHQKTTMGWAKSGRMGDDIKRARIFAEQHVRLISHQLRVGGIEWERKQELKASRGEARTYQVTDYRDDKAGHTYLSTLTRLIFAEDDTWDIMDTKTESSQLQLHILASRTAAAEYELQVVRHRWFPFLGFDGLHPGKEDPLLTCKVCTMDAYFEGVVDHYGPNPLSKTSCAAEVRAVRSVIECTTSSTERLHSENERRANFRSWTTPQDLETLSAWFAAKQCASAKHDSLVYSSRRADRGVPTAGAVAPKPEAGAGKKGRRRWDRDATWGWRAFQHYQGQGEWMGGAGGAMLSVTWRALDAQERDHYLALGKAARELVRLGEQPWPKRAHRRTRAAPPAIIAIGGAAPPPRIANGDGPEERSEGGEVVLHAPVQPAVECQILRDAREAKAQLLSEEA